MSQWEWASQGFYSCSKWKKGKITGNKIHGIEKLSDQQSNPFEIKLLEG